MGKAITHKSVVKALGNDTSPEAREALALKLAKADYPNWDDLTSKEQEVYHGIYTEHVYRAYREG